MEENKETMQLLVSEVKEQEKITFNYEELKIALTEKVSTYKNLVYTEENIITAKADRALLNKLSKAINEEKKRVKNLLLEPYIDFETKCKELMEIVDNASASIDNQIKSFEEVEKNNKLQQILEYWIQHAGEYAEVIEVDKLVRDQWLNKTYSLSKVHDDIDHIITKIKTDFSVLENAINDTETTKRLKDYYLNNIDNPSVLSLTMQEKQRIEESNSKIESLEKTTKSEANTTNTSQNLIENKENVTKDEIMQLDFRVWGTREQLKKLQQFCKENNIKVGSVK